jgi:hypothetical protein
MAVRVAPLTEVVRKCVARQDGGFLIVTKKGSAVSPVELPEGAHVIITDGKAERHQ